MLTLTAYDLSFWFGKAKNNIINRRLLLVLPAVPQSMMQFQVLEWGPCKTFQLCKYTTKNPENPCFEFFPCDVL